MKIPLLLTLLIVTLSCAKGVSLGAYGGIDFFTITERHTGFDLFLAKATFDRTEATTPALVGIYGSIHLPYAMEIALSSELALVNYEVTYSTATLFKESPHHYNLTWGRISFLLTYKKAFLQDKILSPSIGLGVGLHLVAPVVSEKYLQDTLTNSVTPFEPKEDLGLHPVFGGHGTIGLALTPFTFPLSFNVESKITFLQKGEYEEPSTLVSLYGGLSYWIHKKRD